MKDKYPSVKQLAAEAKIDSDEALIRLWYAGFEEITTASDRIGDKDLKRAKKILGIATADEFRSFQYWQSLLGLSVKELELLMKQLSIPFNPEAKKLPRGAVSRLKKEAHIRNSSAYILSKEEGKELKHISISVSHDIERIPLDDSPTLKWSIIGHKYQLNLLNYDQVLGVHNALVSDFFETKDPIIPSGCRNRNLLESALFRPQTSNGGELKYPTVEMAAGALLHSLIHNHPFHNGNKRTALVSMLVFLDMNDFLLTCNEDELYKLVLQVALHRVVSDKCKDLCDREVLAVASWLAANSRAIERGNRPIEFRKLRHILNSHGCDIQLTGKGGSKINISRIIIKKNGFWGTAKEVTLHTQIYYGGEGKEMRRDAINKVRIDLELDEKHGIDAKAFYENAATSVDDFIVTYSKTLNRLAKL